MEDGIGLFLMYALRAKLSSFEGIILEIDIFLQLYSILRY